MRELCELCTSLRCTVVDMISTTSQRSLANAQHNLWCHISAWTAVQATRRSLHLLIKLSGMIRVRFKLCDPYCTPAILTNKNASCMLACPVGAVAEILANIRYFSATAPLTADFSSRGPAPLLADTLLKPDITAPGVQIIAAHTSGPSNLKERLWTPDGAPRFSVLSGTSMS
jgi:hypothetical protein